MKEGETQLQIVSLCYFIMLRNIGVLEIHAHQTRSSISKLIRLILTFKSTCSKKAYQIIG